MNAYAFNLRTRILNSLLNNLIQIPTCLILGYILDNEKLGSRKKRALIGITFDAVWITGTYIAQTAWLASWKFDRSVPGPMIDCTDSAYAGAVVIYMLYAAQYGTHTMCEVREERTALISCPSGIFQNMVIYILGTLTNEPRKTAAIGGLFVGSKLEFRDLDAASNSADHTVVLSSGTAVSFGVDATAQPYENENGAYFALTTICWPILYYIVWKCTTETNYLSEEGVIAPVHVRKEMGIEGVDSANDEEVTEPGMAEKGERR